jgi:hypothetical protein
MVRRMNRIVAGAVLAGLLVASGASVAGANGAPPEYNAGGTVTANPAAVAPGATVNLTGAGWGVAGCDGNISVTGPTPSTAVVATATASAGAWTSSFVMSPSTTAVTRSYVAYCGTTSTTFQVVVLVNTFSDVPNNTWFTEPVEWAAARQITTGVGGTDRFEPSGNVTRAEAVTFMWRLAGSPTTGFPSPPCGFTDVATSAYYAQAVCWAVNQNPKITTGIGGTQGNPSTTFAPNRIVNRSQYITMLWRMGGAPTGAPNAGFTDVPQDAFYFTAVNWAVQQGITTGIGGTSGGNSALFKPLDFVSRAQAVTFLQRFALSQNGTFGPASLSAALVAGQSVAKPASSAPAIGNGIAMLVVVALGVGVGLQLLRPRRLHLGKNQDS